MFNSELEGLKVKQIINNYGNYPCELQPTLQHRQWY